MQSDAERAFEADCGDVRVHTGATADHITREAGAQAVAVGTNIYFSGGEYSPDTEAGLVALMHELTHVAQYLRGARMQYIEEFDELEAEALRVEQLLSRGASDVTTAAASTPSGNQQTGSVRGAQPQARAPQNVDGGGNLEDFRRRRDTPVYRMHLANGKVVTVTPEQRRKIIEDAAKLVRETIEEKRQTMTTEESARYLLRVHENMGRPIT